MIVIAREGYTVLDLLSDIGGIQSLIYSFLALVLSFLNYNYFDDFMITRLFRLEKPDVEK